MRKARFRARASWAKILTLALTAASTVVLGFTWLPARASVALPMVALVTVISALEPFYNWRSRWILMEETQYRLQRLRDEMDYFLVTTPTADVRKSDFDGFFRDHQKIWAETSRRWIEYRRLDAAAQSAEIEPDGTREQ
ncbi:SLATT domain-containing protein [Actinospica sp. MGRD01-02]|uniref:SLATT domain-containing protein n=1 Tax=Actinospica acidithermotolerans TaxID=2828514 RepID=A0A941EDZ8_9ACTN|nr:SLATT domain-containing protein [Actinospica acidithermotolerans]